MTRGASRLAAMSVVGKGQGTQIDPSGLGRHRAAVVDLAGGCYHPQGFLRRRSALAPSRQKILPVKVGTRLVPIMGE
ncbi:MAG: hypothetical protein ACE5JI_07145 [Acidobacteriota bacterium]